MIASNIKYQRILPVFFLFVIVLIGGGYYYYNQVKNGDSAINKKSNGNVNSSNANHSSAVLPGKFHFENSRTISTAADATNGWKTFETKEFSSKYPPAWFYLKNEMNPDTQFGFSNNKDGLIVKSSDVLIDVQSPQPKDATLSIEDYFRKTYGPSAENDDHVLAVERIALNGKTAVEVIWMNGGRWLWVSLASDRLVMLNLITAQDADTDKKVLYDILYAMASTVQMK